MRVAPTGITQRQAAVRWVCPPRIHMLTCSHPEPKYVWDFSDGPVVKNPPFEAGNMGSIPGRGPKIPRAAGQLSPCATTTEPASHNYNPMQGLPGGSVARSPSANAGDTGSITEPGESHMPLNSKTCAPQLLSLCSSAWEH